MVRPVELTLPLSISDVRGLKAGDVVSLYGRIVTGRDRVHKYLAEERPPKEELPFELSGSVLYHCGPVMEMAGDGYKAVSAGPTTSMRVEMYEARIIREYQLRGIMGKGGMGEATRRALKENDCVYLHTIGGAAVYLADRIKRVPGVWKLEEFGQTEAMWLFEVEGFPAIVTMDCMGNDIHGKIEEESFRRFRALVGY
jgi:tartrate/fumarate subfamily iron-sulfur-dependent hydro-lyase beta chain